MAEPTNNIGDKIILVDPNNFSGQNSLDNQSVLLEDLSIYVQLETTKKGRTLLLTTNNQNTSQTSDKTVITFIKGNDKKTLTTNYTNLTTNLKDGGKSEDEETLGISSIDISFGTDYAPIVVINFIDVRGNSIFNKQNNTSTNNDYSIFFQLPYPIFTLTIKGFYGNPVKYQLHMTKFNAKFNSQSGNFEITASFIGYTYAMLSDMLLGYLRAIPYTQRGSKLYESKKVKTLDDLIIIVSKIDEKINKMSNTDPDVQLLLATNDKLEILDRLYFNLKNFVSQRNNDQTNETEYHFFIDDDTVSTKIIDDYNISVSENIKLYNKIDGTDTLNLENFQINDKIRKKIIKYDVNDSEFKIYIKSKTNLDTDKFRYAYDLRNTYKLISEKKATLNTSTNLTKVNIANNIKNQVKQEFNLDLTIEEVVKVFTTAVDVFMEVLYDVSSSAQNSLIRTKELQKFKLKSYDIKDKETKSTTNNDSSGKLVPNYFPWPEYRFSNEKENGTIVEKYLGDTGVLENPKNVDELVFVDDLLKAFLISSKRVDLIENENQPEWFSVNPLDTHLFYDISPYERINANTTNDVVALLLERATIALGISNYKLTNEEIRQIAENESNSILKYVLNDTILQALPNSIQNIDNNISKYTGKINNQNRYVLTDHNDDAYAYNLGKENDGLRIIPLGNKTSSDFSFQFSSSTLNDLYIDAEQNGKLFLTNYGHTNGITQLKENDGGVYLKVFDSTKYNPTKQQEPLLYSELIKTFREIDINKINFKPLNGTYNIQEYKKIKIDGIGDSSEFRIMFYGDFPSTAQGSYLTSSFCLKSDRVKNSDYYVNPDFNKIFTKLDEPQKQITKLRGESFGKNKQSLDKYFNNNTNISFPYINFQTYKEENVVPISLFGSELYYGQETNEAKALLFLHSLPFTGFEKKGENLFVSEILNTFGNRAGFISAPKVWVAFVGGLLWWSEQTNNPIKWFRNDNLTSYVPFLNQTNINSNIAQFLTSFKSLILTNQRQNSLDEVLLQLPEQVKDELKRVFYSFVNDNFPLIQQDLEIATSWSDFINSWTNSVTANTSSSNVQAILNVKNLTYKNLNNYSLVSYYYGQEDFKYNFLLEIKDDALVMNTLINILTEEVYICNTNIFIWDIKSNVNRQEVLLNKNYLNTFLTKVKEVITQENITKLLNDKKKNTEQNLFGSDNETLIKFQIYRTCKNIFDKWISGVEKNKLFFPNKENKYKTLLDSFKFITPSFKDIGKEFYVNPTPIVSYLRYNPNSSFYSCVTDLLSSNNFDFIALPSYINYRKKEELTNLFKPIPNYSINDNITVSSPSFVCVYVGQPSKSLDFNDSNYPNDGFDIRKDELSSIRKDFTTTFKDEKIAVFSVNYGQQNQNIFKDITLDQSEFGETAESLQIIDEIANKGYENRGTFGGQNLYNVYSVRSYKTEVEMMGNAMVQPMMYFQLNNIPMFHGAYLITKVVHNIKPNYMSTKFTGVRIRNVETPLLTVTDLYMPLIEKISSNNSSLSTTTRPLRPGTLATRLAKDTIKCGMVTNAKLTLSQVLELIINNLEGGYCPSGGNCIIGNSGETFWGIDRKNHTGSYDNDFWNKVDTLKNNPKPWNSVYPKWNDLQNEELKNIYVKIIETDYNNYAKRLLVFPQLKALIENDGRLYLNMVYAAFNGSGWFQEFSNALIADWNNNVRTANELLNKFIYYRVRGGAGPKFYSSLIANTGVDIEKMVNLGPNCQSPVV